MAKSTTVATTEVAVDMKVLIDAEMLFVYAEANGKSKIVNLVLRGEVYRITAKDKGFGKLSNGAGWIDLTKVRVL